MKVFSIKNKLGNNLIDSENEEFYQFITKAHKSDFLVAKQVEEIIAKTRKDGDKALIELANKFDKTNFKKSQDFIVSEQDIEKASKALPKELKTALNNAFKRIKLYHTKQLPKDFTFTDSSGTKLGNLWRNIESIGIYVPGGSASYPSSVLMSAIPALVAKVQDISICVPSTSGKINDAVLYAAKICGIKKIYKIGGAQAIAALAYGTKTISKVNKIVGPGNAYVAYAKKIVYGEVGIDMIAGPTDITIIADKNNNPDWIAYDALSQLEHGHDSKAFLITDDTNFANEFCESIKNISKTLQRKEIVKESIKNSAVFLVKDLSEAINLVNFIAPEHLEIATKNAERIYPKVNNAGAIFLGKYTPESIGDYIAGPSHTLPTSASAKFSSGLSVYDFMKRISLISCSESSFKKLSKDTAIMANCEGLEAHKLSITVRQKN